MEIDTQHLDSFITDESIRLAAFSMWYREQHAKSPAMYPLELEPGLWDEQLLCFEGSSTLETRQSLITAAPDLLSLLIAARNELADLNQSEVDEGALIGRIDAMLDRVEQACPHGSNEDCFACGSLTQEPVAR